MKFDNQLRHATHIISSYKGDVPLHVWLKDFFRANKQMGSKDRRLLSQLVYGFYRMGNTLKTSNTSDRMLAALFLCQNIPSEFLAYFKPEWNSRMHHSLDEKIMQLQAEGLDFKLTDLFPWKEELSPDIDHVAFCRSFLRQPDLFVRIRPGFEAAVIKKLDTAQATYELIPPFTLRLPNGFKIEDHLTPDKEVVIQDYSSQRIAEYLRPAIAPATTPPQHDVPPPHFFWDACAASGGKSILAYDLYPQMQLMVSDIRESILRNLRQRFTVAGINKYHAFVVDLARSFPPEAAVGADLILADVPCSGSGTWSRTPEDLYFFHPQKIDQYSGIQESIISHIAPRLSKGTSLVYTTCSVFRRENEAIATLIRNRFHLKEEKNSVIKGYDQHADSMYAARFHV